MADEPEVILWDDVAGRVGGNFRDLDRIRDWINQPTPFVRGDVTGATIEIRDPRHDPDDFLYALTPYISQDLLPEPLRSTPRRPWTPGPPPPPGAIA